MKFCLCSQYTMNVFFALIHPLNLACNFMYTTSQIHGLGSKTDSFWGFLSIRQLYTYICMFYTYISELGKLTLVFCSGHFVLFTGIGEAENCELIYPGQILDPCGIREPQKLAKSHRVPRVTIPFNLLAGYDKRTATPPLHIGDHSIMSDPVRL